MGTSEKLIFIGLAESGRFPPWNVKMMQLPGEALAAT
jgi:hypothetical protein